MFDWIHTVLRWPHGIMGNVVYKSTNAVELKKLTPLTLLF